MTMTLTQARKAHPLASIVLRQLGGGREAIDSAKEAGQHGADAGWPGFTYHSETVPWARRHKRTILDAAHDLARDIGEGGAVALVCGFNCLKDYDKAEVEAVLTGTSRDADTQTAVYNALAWFALEEVGRALEDA
jgi:hypothetical protein